MFLIFTNKMNFYVQENCLFPMSGPSLFQSMRVNFLCLPEICHSKRNGDPKMNGQLGNVPVTTLAGISSLSECK
jgi:hypothetical protein